MVSEGRRAARVGERDAKGRRFSHWNVHGTRGVGNEKN